MKIQANCQKGLIENNLIRDFDSYPFKLVQLRLSLLPQLTPFLLFSALALHQVFSFNWFHNIVFKCLDDLPQGIINCRIVQGIAFGGDARPMTEQNRNYIKKEIGKLLSEIWRIKGLSEQEYGSNHPITKTLISMHGDAQALLQENK